MLIKRAVLFGVIAGLSATFLVFLVIEYLPRPAAIMIPLATLGVAIAFQWPVWFSGDPAAGALQRLGRGLALVAAAAPVAAVTAYLIVLMWPGFISWGENMHRQALVRRGVPPAEIAVEMTHHRYVTTDYLRDGAVAAVMPGAIAALATTAVGAVVLRRRPSRP